MNHNLPKPIRYKSLTSKIKKIGWTLHTTLKEFKNHRTKVMVTCPNGHTLDIVPDSLIKQATNKDAKKKPRGSGCPRCSGMRKTMNDLKDFAISKGWRCLSKSYGKQRDVYLWACPLGHKIENTFHYFQK